MCTRVLWNTNDFAVLTGRSMDWQWLDLADGGPAQAIKPYDEWLVGNVAGRFAPRQIGF